MSSTLATLTQEPEGNIILIDLMDWIRLSGSLKVNNLFKVTIEALKQSYKVVLILKKKKKQGNSMFLLINLSIIAILSCKNLFKSNTDTTAYIVHGLCSSVVIVDFE